MDVSLFTDAKPGELLPIERGEYAFVPAPLPPEWEFPPDLWPLLAEAKRQIGILEGLGRNLPNPAILLRPLEDREAIQSSRLEGTYATPRELLLFEMKPRQSSSPDDPVNQWREVSNYRQALEFGTTTNLPLSLRLIRNLHRLLLHGVRGKQQTPGEFRTGQVAIGPNRRFVPPPANRLMECLDPLEKHLHMPSPRYDPLVDCFLVHYQFEAIHPFFDGNGRVGRLLLAIMLQQRCDLSKPWLYMSEFFEKHRDEYIENLFKVSTSAGWYEWVGFCLRGTVWQAKNTVERCEKLRTVREELMQKIADVGGSVRLVQIVERIFNLPLVRIADVAKELKVTYPTAKADIGRLVTAGILKELEGVTPRTYYAPDVFNVAYEGTD